MRRRLAFALGFLAVIGLATAGVFSRSRTPDPKSILISVAQAMEEAKTIHVVGQGQIMSSTSDPWGSLQRGRYDRRITEAGSRTDTYDESGKLTSATGLDVEDGGMWEANGSSNQWFPHGYTIRWNLGRDMARKALAVERDNFLNGKAFVADTANSTAKEELRDGHKVLVITSTTSNGQYQYEAETVVEADSFRILSFRKYGPESAGRPLVSHFEVDYDAKLPAGGFSAPTLAGAVELNGDYEVNSKTGVASCFYTPGSFAGGCLIKPTASWNAITSGTVGGSDPAAAFDGDLKTAWTTRNQAPGMSFQLNLGEPVTVAQVLVKHADLGESGAGWPRGAQISVSADGVTWQDIYSGQGAAKSGLLGYCNGARPVKAVRITLTAKSDEPWVIGEIELYSAKQAR